MEIAVKVIFVISAMSFGALVSLGVYFITSALMNRERSAIAVAESEIRFRSLFDAIKDAIIVFDFESLKIVETNSEAQEIFGHSKSQFLDLFAWDLSAHKDKTEIRKCFAEWLSQPFNNEINDTVLSADGSEVPINIKLTKGSIDKHTIVIAIYRDMSEIQKARAEIADKISELKNVIAFLSGRELKMIELKEEVNLLLAELGKEVKYQIPADIN